MYKRGGIWYFRIGGIRQSSGTGDKERAKLLQRQREAEAWDRQHGIYIPTWDEACLAWLTENQHLKSYVQQKIFARWWKRHLTGRKLNAITKELVHQIVTTHRAVDLAKASKKNSTANVYVFFVEKIIRAGSNLKPDFIRYKEPKGTRWLREWEWAKLLKVMPVDLRHVTTFALATGLREMNVLRFRWDWCHGDKAYLPATVTKTEEDYGIPLNQAAVAVLNERREMKVRHRDYVFTNGGKLWTCVMVLRAIQRAVKAAEIEHMTFHTMRHTFASWLAQQGVSDAIRCRLGCWSHGEGASGGYVHFDVEGLRPFSELLVPKVTHPSEAVEQASVTERKVS
jgi:integrase